MPVDPISAMMAEARHSPASRSGTPPTSAPMAFASSRWRPGDAIPVDGTIVSGRATVNQAAITGESMPVEVGPEAEGAG